MNAVLTLVFFFLAAVKKKKSGKLEKIKTQGIAQQCKPRGTLHKLAKRRVIEASQRVPRRFGPLCAGSLAGIFRQSRGTQSITQALSCVPCCKCVPLTTASTSNSLTMSSSSSKINKLKPYSQQICCISSDTGELTSWENHHFVKDNIYKMLNNRTLSLPPIRKPC